MRGDGVEGAGAMFISELRHGLRMLAPKRRHAGSKARLLPFETCAVVGAELFVPPRVWRAGKLGKLLHRAVERAQEEFGSLSPAGNLDKY